MSDLREFIQCHLVPDLDVTEYGRVRYFPVPLVYRTSRSIDKPNSKFTNPVESFSQTACRLRRLLGRTRRIGSLTDAIRVSSSERRRETRTQKEIVVTELELIVFRLVKKKTKKNRDLT